MAKAWRRGRAPFPGFMSPESGKGFIALCDFATLSPHPSPAGAGLSHMALSLASRRKRHSTSPLVGEVDRRSPQGGGGREGVRFSLSEKVFRACCESPSGLASRGHLPHKGGGTVALSVSISSQTRRCVSYAMALPAGGRAIAYGAVACLAPKAPQHLPPCGGGRPPEPAGRRRAGGGLCFVFAAQALRACGESPSGLASRGHLPHKGGGRLWRFQCRFRFRNSAACHMR